MSERIVPSWKLNRQRQEVAAGEETKAIRTTGHNHRLPPPPPPPPYVVPMSSNYEVATELTWENGQVAMHGLTGILPLPSPSQPAPNKAPTFVRTGDTLESIVHLATQYKSSTPDQLQQPQQQDDVVVKNAGGNMGISREKRLRTSSESDHEYTSGGGGGAERERSACASASATFCRDAATTMMTWNSFESSPRTFKTKTTDEDSACHDGASENRDDEDVETTTKDETYRSHSARRSRAAIVHNQSERRRRDRINQKMKALQKLVPNASKTDKASMLDEVIEYLKQLQTQVHMLSTTTRSIPQIMINPLAIQQQQQQQQISSILARMGMGGVGLGMGMGMLDMNTLATAAVAAAARSSAPFFQQHHGLIPSAPTFVSPHFVVPAAGAVHASHQPNKSPAGVPFSDPCGVYLSQVCQQKLSALNIKQTMNMEFYNKMAALYREEATNQATQTTSNSSHAKI